MNGLLLNGNGERHRAVLNGSSLAPSLASVSDYPLFANVTVSYSSSAGFSNVSQDDAVDEGAFDYYDISSRAQRFLTQPVFIIALVFGVIVVVTNILSLVVLSHVKSSLTSQFILITSLAFSDILVGVSVLLHIVNKILNPAYYPGYGPWMPRVRSKCGFMIIKALNTTAINITLLNLMGMAIDHYVAILKPLHHSTYMSRRRCTAMIVIFWFIASLCGFSDFISVLGDLKNYHRYKHKYNFCEFVWLGDYQEEYTLFTIALACLCTMLSIYLRIYWEVRHNTKNWPPQQELQKNKKALVTTLLILGTFMLCVMPNCLFQITMIISVKYNSDAIHRHEAILRKADQYLYDLILLNSLCDPLIYAFRIREVRQGYLKLLRCCLGNVLKRTWLAVSEPNSRNYVSSSASSEEQRRLSKSIGPIERSASHVSTQSNSSRAYLIWPWQKETNV